jgi:hypothetical protein
VSETSAQRTSEAAGAAMPRATKDLDWSDAALVASLEAEAYEAFGGGRQSALLRGLWIWDDEAKRVRTRVPDEDQRAWIEVDAGRVHTAILVNVRLAVLQSAAYGFAVPETLDDGRSLCEFTLVFSREEHSLGHFHAAWDEAFGDLRSAGFGDGLATCARRLLPLYRRMGAKVLAEAEIAGEQRYFLHFELTRTSRWNARLVERGEGEAPDHAVPHGDLATALAFARRETSVAIARVLVVMEIARGRPDPAVGLEARHRGARHVLSTARRALREATDSTSPSPAAEAALLQLDDVECLWEAVASFAAAAEGPGRTDESSPVAIAIEALEALLLTLLEAWDGDREAAALLVEMTRGDRGAQVAEMAARRRSQGELEAAAHLERIASPFANAVAAMARIASREAS